MIIKKKKDVLYVAILMFLLLLLIGCGKNSDKNSSKNYIGRYKQYHTGGSKRYLEINDDSTARIYDSYDTYAGEWKEINDKNIELTLTEFGTEIFYAEFAEDDNIDVLKVSGGYYGDDMAYYVREDSETRDMLANYDVQQVLDALAEGVSINEINTYISNTVIAGAEIKSFDPFDSIDVVFDGIAPYGHAQIEKNNNNTPYKYLYYKIDNDNNLSNGDKITIKVEGPNSQGDINNYCLEKFGMIPAEIEREYTVEGLATYVRSATEIPEDVLQKMKNQTEDVLKSRIEAGWRSEVTLEQMEYIGNYFLWPKNEKSSDDDKNRIVIMYRVTANIDYSDREDEKLVYYYPITFYNAVIMPNGECSVDLSRYNQPGSNFWVHDKSWNELIEGFESIDSAFGSKVTSNIDKYNYEDNVNDEITQKEKLNTDQSIDYMGVYNSLYSDREAVPYFINMDDDEELELVVVSVKDKPDHGYEDSIYVDTELVLYDYKDGKFSEVYSDPVNKRYYLALKSDGSQFLIYSTRLNDDIYEFDASEQYFAEFLSMGEMKETSLSSDEFTQMLPGVISMNESIKARGSNRLTRMSLSDISRYDYTSDMVKELISWGKKKQEIINDVLLVDDKDGLLLYATLGPYQPDEEIKRPNGGSYYIDSYAEVINIDKVMTFQELGKIELAHHNNGHFVESRYIYGYGSFRFKDAIQYYVEVSEGEGVIQYKYGKQNGEIKLIDATMDFIQDGDTVYCCSYRKNARSSAVAWPEWVEVTYEDDEYKQYASELLEESEIYYEIKNFRTINDDCVKDISELDSLDVPGFGEEMQIKVDKVRFKDIMKGANGKYYITYLFDYTDMSDYSNHESYSSWVYFTFKKNGSRLVRDDRVNFVEKLETSELDLPVIER